MIKYTVKDEDYAHEAAHVLAAMWWSLPVVRVSLQAEFVGDNVALGGVLLGLGTRDEHRLIREACFQAFPEIFERRFGLGTGQGGCKLDQQSLSDIIADLLAPGNIPGNPSELEVRALVSDMCNALLEKPITQPAIREIVSVLKAGPLATADVLNPCFAKAWHEAYPDDDLREYLGSAVGK